MGKAGEAGMAGQVGSIAVRSIDQKRNTSSSPCFEIFCPEWWSERQIGDNEGRAVQGRWDRWSHR